MPIFLAVPAMGSKNLSSKKDSPEAEPSGTQIETRSMCLYAEIEADHKPGLSAKQSVSAGLLEKFCADFPGLSSHRIEKLLDQER